jgi:hypothetical protein
MRIPAFASACLGLLVAVALVAACLPEKVPAAGQSKGHEETKVPTVKPGPFPDQAKAAQPAARVVEPTPPPPALPGCRSLGERVQSVKTAAPDAKAEHLAGPPALEYVAAFNVMHRTAIEADEVAIVASALWGNHQIVLFQLDGCEAGTKQITFSVPGQGHE